MLLLDLKDAKSEAETVSRGLPKDRSGTRYEKKYQDPTKLVTRYLQNLGLTGQRSDLNRIRLQKEFPKACIVMRIVSILLKESRLVILKATDRYRSTRVLEKLMKG